MSQRGSRELRKAEGVGVDCGGVVFVDYEGGAVGGMGWTFDGGMLAWTVKAWCLHTSQFTMTVVSLYWDRYTEGLNFKGNSGRVLKLELTP